MGMVFNPQTCRYEYIQDYMPQLQQVKTPQPSQQGLLWVSGEVGAKSWVVSPNTTVLLMDSESNHFYIKSSDSAGMPTIKTYEYKEVQKLDTQNTQSVDNSLFDEVKKLREEVNILSNQIDILKESKSKKGVKNEQPISDV